MLALTGGRILTMAGREYERGTILVDSGKIVALGDRVDVPPGSEQIDLSGMFVLPGFIDAHCHIGVFEEGVEPWTDDANEMTSPRMPQVRVIDAINPADIAFADARAAGFTTVLVHPGSGNVIGGQSAVIKTAGNIVDDMVIKNPAGMKFAFGGNPKRDFPRKNKDHPKTRMGVAATFRQALIEAREYAERRKKGEAVEYDLGSEALLRVLSREIPARVHVARADDILTVIRLCKEFNIEFTLEHVTEGHLVVDDIVESGAPCVIGPMFFPRGASETRNLTFRTPGVLASRGVLVALTVDHPMIPLKHAIYQAAVAVKAGMTQEDALKALTINGALIAGVADTVGSLEPGKDADLVVLTGHPFDLRTDVYMTMIDGKVVFKKCC